MQQDQETAGYSATPDSQSRHARPDLCALISSFRACEDACDAAITRQEKLIRDARHGRLNTAWSTYDSVDDSSPAADGWTAPQGHGREDFARRAEAARRVGGLRGPHTTARLARSMQPGEIDRIEELEREIMRLRLDLDRIETTILDAFPSSHAEAVAKLRFISAILVEGREIEIDHFAYIVGECATVLAA